MDEKKASKSKKKGSAEKLHVEIAPGNWARLEGRLKSYNNSPDRITPKIKPADVVNEALARFLKMGEALSHD